MESKRASVRRRTRGDDSGVRKTPTARRRESAAAEAERRRAAVRARDGLDELEGAAGTSTAAGAFAEDAREQLEAIPPLSGGGLEEEELMQG